MEIKRGIRPWDYCVPDDGESHDIPVVKGDSAYEIALAHGYTGTEEEWLQSLQGKSAYEIAVEHGYEGTEEEWIASLNPDKFMKLEGGNHAIGNQVFEGNISTTTLTSGTITPASSGATIGSPNNWFGKIYTLGGLMERNSGGVSFKVTPRLADQSGATHIGVYAIKIPESTFAQYEINFSEYGVETNRTSTSIISLSFDLSNHTLRTDWSSIFYRGNSSLPIRIISKKAADNSTEFYITFGDPDTTWGEVIPNINCLVAVSNFSDLMYIKAAYVASIITNTADYTVLLQSEEGEDSKLSDITAPKIIGYMPDVGYGQMPVIECTFFRELEIRPNALISIAPPVEVTNILDAAANVPDFGYAYIMVQPLCITFLSDPLVPKGSPSEDYLPTETFTGRSSYNPSYSRSTLQITKQSQVNSRGNIGFYTNATTQVTVGALITARYYAVGSYSEGLVL